MYCQFHYHFQKRLLITSLLFVLYLCDGEHAAHTHRSQCAPHTTANQVPSEQLRFSILQVLDSLKAHACKVGWQKHTQLVANEWSSGSSPSCRCHQIIKRPQQHREVTYVSCFCKIDTAIFMLHRNRQRNHAATPAVDQPPVAAGDPGAVSEPMDRLAGALTAKKISLCFCHSSPRPLPRSPVPAHQTHPGVTLIVPCSKTQLLMHLATRTHWCPPGITGVPVYGRTAHTAMAPQQKIGLRDELQWIAVM